MYQISNLTEFVLIKNYMLFKSCIDSTFVTNVRENPGRRNYRGFR